MTDASPCVPANNDVPFGMDIFHNSQQCPNCGNIWGNANQVTDPGTMAAWYGASAVAGAGGYVIYDLSQVENGLLFGTRLGGNTPLLNSGDALRIGWSYIGATGQYVFRIGGDLIGTTLGVLLCILLAGCSRDARASSSVKAAVQLEQTVNHKVIGRRDNGRLDYLDMTSNGAITTVSFSERQEVTATSIDLTKGDEISSSDERWTAHCNRNAECQISKVGDPSKTFSVSRKGILTPLYWSPDGRFVFFVRQAPTWRFPPRCSLEDERDVTVYDLTQGREDIVSTVCGGYPYGGLRWYKLTAD